MKIYLPKTKHVLVSIALILVVASVAVVMATKRGYGDRTQDGEHVTEKLPPVISKVAKLEVVNVTLEKHGSTTAMLVIEVRNNSDQAVLALTIESGDDRNSSGINTHGDLDSEKPPVIIKPHDTAKFAMALSEMIPGTALRVAGVLYADGTEDGDESTLRTMRSQRAHDRAERESRKGVLANEKAPD